MGTFNADLNIIQNSGIPAEVLEAILGESVLDPIEDDLDVVQKLDDEPNDVGGLTAAELKAKFDEAGNIIKAYINGELIPKVQVEEALIFLRGKVQAEAADAARQAAEEAQGASETAQGAAEAAAEAAAQSAAAANEDYWTGYGHMNLAIQASGRAETARDAAIGAQEGAETARIAAEAAKMAAEMVQAALHLRSRIYVGPASDIDKLSPGDTLIPTDGADLGDWINYQDIVEEARKAAANMDNRLDEIAVLSKINATNIRRDENGLLWTTDTVEDFKEKLIAFAAAAVAAGYVDRQTNKCTVTWSQLQVWLLIEELYLPLDAENCVFPWRREPPKTRLDAVVEDVEELKASLRQAANNLQTIVEGGQFV